MSTIAPFRGLLYSASRVPDLEPVLSPAHEPLNDERLDALRARGPLGIVHIDQPGPGPEAHERAGATLSQWRRDGVLEQDPRPGLYVAALRYRARGMAEKTLLGFFARLLIEGPDSEHVRCTERPIDEASRSRARLTRALEANVSPVTGLFEDPGNELSAVMEAVSRRPADRWASEASGLDVRLWRVTDPTAVHALVNGMRARGIWIVEEAHRWAAAREVRDALRALEPDAPAGSRSHDHALAFLAPLESPGITFTPWHRVIRGSRRFNARSFAGGSAGHIFDVKHFAFEGYDNRAEQVRRRLREAAARGRTSVGLYCGGGEFALYLLRDGQIPDEAAAQLPGRLRGIDVAVLDTVLLPLARTVAHAEDNGASLLHFDSVAEAMASVDAGEGSAALLLNPPVRDTLIALSREGLALGPRSTGLLPRVPAGLVIDSLVPADDVHAAPRPMPVPSSPEADEEASGGDKEPEIPAS